MIVKNEEDTLPRCLKSVLPAVDELVIVDTGSTDGTKKIAESFCAKVYDYPWQDDFAAARNFSFSKATKDFVMWLDADDVIDADNLQKLLRLKDELTENVLEVAAKYEVAFDEAGRCTLSYDRERIFLRKANLLWSGEVHETIPLLPDALFSDVAVRHAKIHPTEQGRNLRIYQNLLARGKSFTPRQTYYYARELFYNGYYEEAENRFRSFLSGEGWLPDKIGASLLLSECCVRLGKKTEAKTALFDSFLYGIPDGRVCCEIGGQFFADADYQTAAYWYERALDSSDSGQKGAFFYPDSTGYIPHIQLCVCYDRLGDTQKARAHNEAAAVLKPESRAVQWNRDYFHRLDSVPTD